MNKAKAPSSFRLMRIPGPPSLVAGLLLSIAALAVVAIVFWPRSAGIGIDGGEQEDEDPRISFETPFRNVRPGVKYVGDKACSGCHPGLDQSYHRHSMGRSLAPVSTVAALQQYGEDVHNPFYALGRLYRVDRQDGRVVHKEISADAIGRVAAQTQAQMDFVIGSGERAYSYLYTRGDRVFQSPITWFTQKQCWDLSPGYEGLKHSFERPITASCLFCHCNYVEPVKETFNRFTMPLFSRGAAIGCERCHGPGELHVNARTKRFTIPKEGDDTIVNPRRLPPDLREAVCQQCHLEGESNILRRGRREFDFRPGMPLHLFWSVFVAKADLSGQSTFVGHVEQMYASRCFVQSNGKLGCISCHDPHALPVAEKKAEYFRNKCLNCHNDKGCSETLPQRVAENKNNCIACHMHRLPSADIRHTAVTDHHIPRHPQKNAAPRRPRMLKPGESPIVHFHRDLVAAGDKDVERDLGLALVQLAKMQTPTARQLCETAYPYLQAALRRESADAHALQASAFVLEQKGMHLAALQLIEKILSRAPNDEAALESATNYAERARDFKKALIYAQRFVKINPWITRNRAQLAGLLIRHNEYGKAIVHCQETLKFNPGSVGIRSLLVSCYLQTRQWARARQEFDVIMRLNPPNKQELRRWFEEQMR